jgi:hypothetical protein
MERAMGAASYDELVTVATVGLSRRQLPLAAAPGPRARDGESRDDGEALAGDAADALLEAAARWTVARRAGLRPASGIAAPPPMPADRAAELPARAGHLLRRVTSDPELLADLLMVAAEAGFRAPAPLLPALLDAAVRSVALRPAVNATLGSRGRWLAAQRGDWRRILEASGTEATSGAASGGAASPLEPGMTALDQAGQPACGDPRAWETGTRAQRVAYLTALRAREPLAARELLAAGWSRETAEERGQLLAVLSRGLSAEDEAFLEGVLDDRASWVRAAARRLLGQLPGSAFNQRAARRASQVLRLRGGEDGRWLEARLPVGAAAPADDLARDGITTSSPGPGIGGAAWLLTQLIAAVPLGDWTRQWGLDAPQIASLPIEGGLDAEVYAGWRLATVSQRDPGWAAALLSGAAPLLAPDRPEPAWPGNHVLAAVLDPATRAALAPGVIARITKAATTAGRQAGNSGAPNSGAANSAAPNSAAAAVIAELYAWPGPWPDALADLVMGLVASNLSAQGAVRSIQGLLGAAARNIPVTGPRDYAAELTRLAQSPTCAFPWLSVLRRTADTLTVRRAFQDALTAQRKTAQP